MITAPLSGKGKNEVNVGQQQSLLNLADTYMPPSKMVKFCHFWFYSAI